MKYKNFEIKATSMSPDGKISILIQYEDGELGWTRRTVDDLINNVLIIK